MTNRLQEMDERILRINLYLTQLIVIAVAAGCSFLLLGWEATGRLFRFPDWRECLLAIWAAGLVVSFSLLAEHFLPKHWQDDGDINRRIFAGLPFWPTLLLCVMVGISEEWLFRGLLQTYLGIGWTSLLFTLIHFRYLRKPFLLFSVFLTSLLLGCLFARSHHLLSPMIAHALIDLIQARYLQAIAKNEGRFS